jgi:tyrosinase
MEKQTAERTQSKVVILPHDKIVARQNLIQFMYPNRSQILEQDGAQIHRDLFLHGFATLKRKHYEDPRSFYQIAGIHGLPWEPYDGITGNTKQKFSGYCEHGSILFPTWHRPYMLLLEQEIISCALEFIDDYQTRDGAEPLTNDQKEFYKKLAKDIRLPYWDWTDSYSQCSGLPACLTDDHLAVVYPQKNSIPNPLRCYVLPVNLFSPLVDYSSPESIPKAKPNYAPKQVDVPFTPEFYPTIRHPTPEYKSNELELKFDLMKQCNTLYRPAIYGMFKVNLWTHFSNHFDDHDSTSPDSLIHNSIEFVHDNVHVNVGGVGGHMASVDVAAFDPNFFLHHANVDRLCALWQITYPEDSSWIKPSASCEGTYVIESGQTEDENTPLFPFLKKQPKATPKGKHFWSQKMCDMLQI